MRQHASHPFHTSSDLTLSSALPRYEFMYKQAVQSTDVFLGMSGKDESSTSCEDMVLKISLPEVAAINGAV